MIASRTGCGLCNNLGQKKIEQQAPTPQKNQGWSRAEAKTRHFIISDPGEMGGGGGLNFPCVFSKIAVELIMYDLIVFDQPHVNKRPVILKISSC